MIVLWVLLGIFVGLPAVIILLLSFPVSIKVKTRTGAPVEEPILNEDMERQICELGLSPEDEQELRKVIEQSGPVKKEGEKEIFMTLQWLFLKIPILPQKEKPQTAKEEKTQKPEPEKTETEEKPKTKIDIKHLVPLALKSLKKPLGMIFKDICIKNLEVDGVIAQEDSAQTALSVQKFVTSGHTLLAVLENIIKIKRAKLNIRPDFTAEPSADWNFTVHVRIHPVIYAAAGIRFCWKMFQGGVLDMIGQKQTSPQKAHSGAQTTAGEQK